MTIKYFWAEKYLKNVLKYIKYIIRNYLEWIKIVYRQKLITLSSLKRNESHFVKTAYGKIITGIFWKNKHQVVLWHYILITIIIKEAILSFVFSF